MTAAAEFDAGPLDRPDDRASYQVITASHELRAVIEDSLLPLGISMAQWTVLVQLLMDPGRSSAQIARSSAVSQQAISGLVARLERDGLLTRKPHPDHGRIKRLTPTNRGRRVAIEADDRVRVVEQELRAHLGDADADELCRLLVRVREFLAQRPR